MNVLRRDLTNVAIVVVAVIIVLECNGFSEAILSGGPASNNQTEASNKTEPKINSFKVSTTSSNIETNNNNTFYYEADTFLLNRNEQNKQQASSRDTITKSVSRFEPASMGSTSARSGRMLDLDALVGDLSASQSAKARSQTGNRQSRFLPSSSQMLEVGNGKRLHIQGFIPIVGVKDVTNEDSTADSSDQEQQQQSATPSKRGNEDLPYAQSSIGHASFIPQQQQQQQQQQYQQQLQAAQVDAKFSGAGVVDTLRKPLKKWMRYGETHQQHGLNGLQRQQQQQPAGCLCVPFYMCKNGLLSESGLSGSQVQQLILNQQQQNYPSSGATLQPKAAQLMLAPAPKAIDSYAQQFATFSAQVDERSLDRDIITMAPLVRPTDEREQQQTGNNQTNIDAIELQQLPSLAANNHEGEAINSTSGGELTNQANDYSQDILGRMLGIKSITGGSKPSGGDLAGGSTAGVCGLLRTCCSIPAHLLTASAGSQQNQDYSGGGDTYSSNPSQSQMSFSGSSSGSQPMNTANRYSANHHHHHHHHQTNQFADMVLPSQQQQQIVSLQKYQQQSNNNALQTRGNPYGFPSMQISRMQPLNSPDQLALMSTALAHRSNMFPSSNSNRFQVMPPSQPSDYKRAPQQMQYVPTMQQQQLTSMPMSLSAHQTMTSVSLADQIQGNAVRMAPQIGSSTLSNPSLVEGLGTRKILEGRCGLRQSAGISGRVQNLQYQENSADFGEYPAQTAILKRLTGTDSMFVCGGTLISQYWIATAAHCIKKHSINDLKVRLGEWDVHRDDEFYPYVEKGIRDLVIHSEFVPGNLVNDIALLRLDSPIDVSLPHVNPACLPSMEESFTNQKCWVTGWGKDSFGQKGSFQTVLQEVELPIIGQAECESALKQTRLGPHYRLHSGFICAGGEGGKDACEGDGGSGLYCMQDGLIKVVGLVSWGIGCGQPGIPGVYVNLAHYRPWIENIISIDEDIYSRNSNNITDSDKTTTMTPSR